nr:hypothetical protein [Tanacetum cinerariifolium]
PRRGAPARNRAAAHSGREAAPAPHGRAERDRAGAQPSQNQHHPECEARRQAPAPARLGLRHRRWCAQRLAGRWPRSN